MGDNLKRIRQIKEELCPIADEISKRYCEIPVVIIVAGSLKANVPQCVTVFSKVTEGREGRMRDQLGILQTAMQIETLKHFRLIN